MSFRRLEMRDVAKSYGAAAVLDGLSLSISAGEFVSLVGPSGAGKSTAFKLLTRELTPDRGEISLDGKALSETLSRFAFMPQHDCLLPWRRLLDNATLGLEVAGLSRDVARSRVQPLLQEFGLAGFEEHFPHQLSGGMRQRAALLRTVVQQTDVLLLDEPFGALDALTRAAMQLWLEQQWQRHRWTAMLITHDVREAILLSDRIYVLSPRPARVLLEVQVALDRPRTREFFKSAVGAELEAQILDILLVP